jgi:hypothetical protein
LAALRADCGAPKITLIYKNRYLKPGDHNFLRRAKKNLKKNGDRISATEEGFRV